MPAAMNKQQLFTQVHTLLQKHFTLPTDDIQRTVFEQVIYAICREGSTRGLADPAFRNLQTFFDWNEVRVSSVREIAEAIEMLPEPEARARRIVRFLQEWFEMTYSFDMEELTRKGGLREASKKLSRLENLSDFIIAFVIQHGLGGHAVPVDAPAMRVLHRLQVIEAEEDSMEAARGTVEHYVTKTRGPGFTDLVSVLAHEICTDRNPRCGSCPLQSECPSAYTVAATAAPRPESPSPRKPR